jgi:heme-degrading monooxygenase HmoA
MPEFIEMDEKVTVFAQMEEKGGPVILINTFTLTPEEVNQFLQTWAADAEIMKRQPGFISTQLHRGIAGSCVFVNYAIWESTEQFKQAFNNPEFQAVMANYPSNAKASPHLFRKVAVPGICVAA